MVIIRLVVIIAWSRLCSVYSGGGGQCKMGRQRLWPLNPPTKMTQAMMTSSLMMTMMTIMMAMMTMMMIMAIMTKMTR